MRTETRRAIGVVALALAGLLLMAPVALAASAVDQYSEGIPTARGQKPTTGGAGGAGTATISPQTSAQLEKSKNGSAAEHAAKLTAPSRSGPAAPDTSDTGDGLGLLLPVILLVTLAVGVGMVVARRRLRATPG
jgi:hypothetical protein